MSTLGRTVSGKVVGGFAALIVVAALLPLVSQSTTREITLVADDMAFYLEGDPSRPNPTIEVKAGERIRVVLRNEERGLIHDFALPAAGAGIDALGWNERGDVTFEVPDVPGNYEYVCRPHLLMMKGVMTVVAR